MEFKNLPLPFCRQAQIKEKYGLDKCYLAMAASEIA
jgi:hypothetical protein